MRLVLAYFFLFSFSVLLRASDLEDCFGVDFDFIFDDYFDIDQEVDLPQLTELPETCIIHANNIKILEWCADNQEACCKILVSMPKMPHFQPFMTVKSTRIDFNCNEVMTPLQVHFFRYFLFALLTGKSELASEFITRDLVDCDRKLTMTLTDIKLELSLEQFYLTLRSFDPGVFNHLHYKSMRYLNDLTRLLAIAIQYDRLQVVEMLTADMFDLTNAVTFALYRGSDDVLRYLISQKRIDFMDHALKAAFFKTKRPVAILMYTAAPRAQLYVILIKAYNLDHKFGHDCVLELLNIPELGWFFNTFVVHLIRTGNYESLQAVFNKLRITSPFPLLHEALKYGQVNEILDLLIKQGYIFSVDKHGKTALQLATEIRSPIAIKKLGPCCSHHELVICFKFAVFQDYCEVAEALLQFIPSVDYIFMIEDRIFPLIEFVIRERRHAMLDVILNSRKVDPELEHRSGISLRKLGAQSKDRSISFKIFAYAHMMASFAARK